MRRRQCAALLLCAPLVAGCGAAARVHFAPQSRTAPPVQISVLAGPQGLTPDPSRVSPGPVLLNIANQSGHPERFWISAGKRVLARSPTIGSGQTAQLKATLTAGNNTLAGFSQLSPRRTVEFGASLSAVGRPRSGANEVSQP